MKEKDMPAQLTTNDYMIAGDACHGMAVQHRSDGEYREALRYAVIGLKLYAHIREFNGQAQLRTVYLCDLIEACTGKKKHDLVQDLVPPAAG